MVAQSSTISALNSDILKYHVHVDVETKSSC